ncbi:hypothetical protein OAL15_00620 [Flavobacteriales bacterium]|nr:hypothetical protein [Flavobacteriales bacterium]
MEAIFTTLTDKQRVETLNNLYQKGLSTPKEQLAFSADKLVYIKPFLCRLQNQTGTQQELSSLVMAREVIDELLKDILDEVNTSVADDSNKNTLEYGLQSLIPTYVEDFYFTNKVA